MNDVDVSGNHLAAAKRTPGDDEPDGQATVEADAPDTYTGKCTLIE
jgi:hypothetical protein